MDKSSYWFITYTGKKFNLIEPNIENIDIIDIAHALSMICRYGGHLPEHYSVAQHSLLVATLLPPHLQLEGLLHDAAEAYIGDIVRPLKKYPAFREVYIPIENHLNYLIQQKFNLMGSFSEYIEIKQADNIALLTEKRDLFPAAEKYSWGEEQAAQLGNGYANIQISFIHPMMAKANFLKAFEQWKR